MQPRRIELLSPAGDMETLKTAAYFGADAVYAAGKTYGLRAFADNFTVGEIKEAASFLHSSGKKLYIALNLFFHERDFPGLEGYLAQLKEAQVDALIISDPGALQFAKKTGIPVHLSTQANTTNKYSASFWHTQGVKRIILSRELSLSEIADIREGTPDTLELEAFIHGSMCISYSGRCLLSSFFTGRSANRGECAQPCRWEYHISEKGYEGEYFPVLEDDRGTYILNSKDLCMIEHLYDIAKAGVVSVKIEGRMKSEYYVGCVTKAYRRALDDLAQEKEFDSSLLEEISKAGSRAFTKGFYYGNPRQQGQETGRSGPQRGYDFVAMVREKKNAEGLILIEQRVKFSAGDKIEVLSPDFDGCFAVKDIITPEGERRESAPHPKEALYISCPYDLKPYDMLRKKHI
jgi:U32 family peptidase